MVLTRFILSLILLSSIYLRSFSQEPCTTEPYRGYKGDCNITKAMSADGKYIYTSDRLTLKIWDVVTNKVIDEVNPFPFDIAGHALNVDRIYVHEPNDPSANLKAYDLKSRAVLVPATGITPEIEKILAKETMRYTELPEFESVVYNKDAKLIKFNTRTQKTISLGKNIYLGEYLREAKVIFGTTRSTQGLNHLQILNLENDSWIETTIFYGGDRESDVISNRYVPVYWTNKLRIVDTQTGNLVLDETTPFTLLEPRFFFKPDRSGIYAFVIGETSGMPNKWTSEIREYTYPGFQLVAKTPVKGKVTPHSLFNPATGTFYNEEPFAPGSKKDLEIIDFRTGTNKGEFILEEKGKFENAGQFAAERDHRARIGNQAIEALHHIRQSVNPFHSHLRISNKLIIDDYAKNGRVIVREDQFHETLCITWKFPEGTPEYFYKSAGPALVSNSPGEVLVPAVIQNSMLSPSGSEAGFNTEGGAYIYRGNKLIFKAEKKILKSLLDGRAVICTPLNYINPSNYQCAKLELVDLTTGGVINSALLTSMEGESPDRTKLFLNFSPKPTPILKMIDVSNPSQVITVTGSDIEKSGFPLYTVTHTSAFRKHKITGKEEVITGYRIPNIGAFQQRHLKIKNNYIMSFDASYGFNVFDITQGKSIAKVPLYAGWWQFEDMLYVESINKLLVVNRAPSYTWPEPADNDPGASAFTIDLETGEITPYLMTENRAQYLANKKASAAAVAYRYSPEGKCKARNNQFAKGVTLFQNGVSLYGIVLGYDCEEEAYVIAYREPVDQKEALYQLRLKKATFEELGALTNGGSLYRICPSCHGHPVDFKTSTVSGWSDWEQKSLNIYVYRKEWETKSVTKRVVCQVCKGAALIK